MVKSQKEKDKERGSKGNLRSILMSFRNCATEVKFLLTAVLFLCFLLTFLLLSPVRVSTSSSACLSTVPTNPTILSISLKSSSVSNGDTLKQSSSESTLPQSVDDSADDKPTDKNVVKHSFKAVGTAAYNFILMSAYRGGPNTFVVMGLGSKTLETHGYLTYTCEYQSTTSNVKVTGRKLNIPDWGFARVYSVIVINCTFPYDLSSPVANPAAGGKLIVHAHSNGGFDKSLNHTDTIETLVEQPNSWDLSSFISEPKYDFLYCGSSLFGNLSPQRVREWMAYHVRLFGKKSHFVINDAGGVHPEVLEVLKPWMELGYVTLTDVKGQERFDGFYHNQVLVLNDCLHRYKFQTKWMFFFDVDEYIYVDPKMELSNVMDSFKDFSQVTFDQLTMSNSLCLADDATKATKEWGFEKLVYRNTKKERRDRKYAVQPKDIFATGVHMSHDMQGRSTVASQNMMRYFHFHGSVAEHRELCRNYVNKSSVVLDGSPYVLDTTLRSMAPIVKSFELKSIGSRLQQKQQ